MRSFFATLQQLVVPAGAGANAPAVSLGAQVPAEVAALYAPARVVACMIFRRGGGTYLYLALVVPTVGTPYVALGGIESVSGIVREAWRVRPAFGNVTTTFGALGSAVLDVGSASDLRYGGESMVRTSAWVPEWTSSGGGFALGDGVSTGLYVRQGAVLHFTARLTVGSTTTLGGGALGTTNLPADPATDLQMVVGLVRDAAPVANVPILARLTSSGAGAITEMYVASSGAVVTNTTPITPATGDIYQITGWYLCQ